MYGSTGGVKPCQSNIKQWEQKTIHSKLFQFLKITELIRRALMRLQYAYTVCISYETREWEIGELTTAGSKATREGDQCSVNGGGIRARGRRWGTLLDRLIVQVPCALEIMRVGVTRNQNRSLLGVERDNSRQLLALKQLETGASTSGHMAHLRIEKPQHAVCFATITTVYNVCTRILVLNE